MNEKIEGEKMSAKSNAELNDVVNSYIVIGIFVLVVVAIVALGTERYFSNKAYYNTTISNMVDEEWSEYLESKNIQSVTLTSENIFGDCSLEIDFIGHTPSFENVANCLGLGEVSIKIEDGEIRGYIPKVNESEIS